MSRPKSPAWKCRECGAPYVKATETSVMAVCVNGCGKLQPVNTNAGRKAVTAEAFQKIAALPVVEVELAPYRGRAVLSAVIDGERLYEIKSRKARNGKLVRTKDWGVVRLHRAGKDAELAVSTVEQTAVVNRTLPGFE